MPRQPSHTIQSVDLREQACVCSMCGCVLYFSCIFSRVYMYGCVIVRSLITLPTATPFMHVRVHACLSFTNVWECAPSGEKILRAGTEVGRKCPPCGEPSFFAPRPAHDDRALLIPPRVQASQALRIISEASKLGIFVQRSPLFLFFPSPLISVTVNVSWFSSLKRGSCSFQ
jgi:hypothetical protein